MSRREILSRTVDADLVGISTITATATSAYALADHFHQQGIPVVFGGPHVTFVPEEALEHGDYCIIGRRRDGPSPAHRSAERRWPACRCSRARVERERHHPQKPAGASHRGPGQPALPRPWAPGHGADEEDRRPGHRAADHPDPDVPRLPLRLHVLLGHRDVRQAIPAPLHRQHHRGAFEVRSAKTSVLFFYDDNFAANPRKTKELLREMIRLQLGFRWSTQVRSDIARDPEMLDLMARGRLRPAVHRLRVG